MPGSPTPTSNTTSKAPKASFLTAFATKLHLFVQNLASQGIALRSYFRNVLSRRKSSSAQAQTQPSKSTAQVAPHAVPPYIQIHPHWYKKPKVAIPLVLFSISYIYLNIWVYNRAADISSMKLPFLSAFIKNPLQKTIDSQDSAVSSPDSSSQPEDRTSVEPQGTPTPAFTLNKKVIAALASEVRSDIPQAIDVTIDPLSKESKTYAILVSAHDSSGIQGVTVTIPSSKKPPRKLALVKGTAQDGIWRTDTVLNFTGPTIQLVIDVENAGARTTTEVTVP